MEHRTSKNDFDFSLQRPSGSDSAAVATQDQQRPVSTVELQPPNAFSGASCESALATMMRPQFSDMVSIDADTAVSLTNAPYRWWEDEAQPILWAFNIADINRLLRFRLYDNDEFPKMILQLRNTDTLSEFVIALVPGSMPGLLGLTHQEKVDEIIRLCRPNHFAPPWNWIPSYLNEMYPAKLAMEINIESILQFRAVPFEDWVRYALGYPTLSVVWFLEQHMQLYKLVSEYLSKYPERYHIYVEAEKVCPEKSYRSFCGLTNIKLAPSIMLSMGSLCASSMSERKGIGKPKSPAQSIDC